MLKKISNNCKKVLASKENGKPIRIYRSIEAVVKHHNTYRQKVLNHLESGKPFEGMILTYIDAWLPKVPRIPKEKKRKPEKKADKKDREWTESNKPMVLPYEVKNSRICITPCPYQDAPKPMIGSGRCVNCSSNYGRNIKTHEVLCGFAKRFN